MLDVGYALNPDDLVHFFRGFTTVFGLFDVIVTSRDEYGTRDKIKAHFDSDINDVGLRCKHLVLGCSHDGTYRAMVRRYNDNLTYHCPL